MTDHTATLIMRNLSGVTHTEWIPFGTDRYATTIGTITLIAGGSGREWELTVGRAGWTGGKIHTAANWPGLVSLIRGALK